MMQHSARAMAARALLVSIALLPFAPRFARGVPGLSWFGEACESWFAVQCQRDPARSLRLFGELLPICARCTGIYWGFGFGAVALWPRLTSPRLGLWVGFACGAMLLDVLSEAFGLRPAWAPLRVLTGVSLSYPVSVALVAAARVHWPRARGLRDQNP